MHGVVRLSVKTSGCDPDKTGSIPVPRPMIDPNLEGFMRVAQAPCFDKGVDEFLRKEIPEAYPKPKLTLIVGGQDDTPRG